MDRVREFAFLVGGNFDLLKPGDDRRPEPEANQKRHDARAGRPEGDVPEQIKNDGDIF